MSHRDIPVECYDAADYTDTKKLPQWAIEDLEKSGLDKDSVRLMQCIPVLNSDHLKDLLGFNQIDGQDILTAVGDAYAIPYWENEPDKGEEIQPSFYRVKLQKPFIRKNGNEIKYLSPHGTKANPFHAYFMPCEQYKFTKRKSGIIINEGEKKTAKVAQELRNQQDKTTVCLGFPGVTMWQDWQGWQELRLSGKQVWICFDAQDYGSFDGSSYQNSSQENCMVEIQTMKLWLFLMYEKKARDAKIVTWDEVEKFKGIDDYLASHPGELKSLLDSAGDPFEVLPLFHAANGWQPLAEIIASLFMNKKTYTAIYEAHHLQKRYGLSLKTWQQKMAAAIAKSQNKKAADKAESETKDEPASEIPECNWIDEKGKINTGIAAESFILSTKGNLIYSKENFYEFVAGVWKIVDDRIIANRIRNMLGDSKAKQPIIHDILYQVTIILLQKCEKIRFNTHQNKLCFTNCVLDIDTFQMELHNRMYFQTIQFPYEYKPIDITLNDHDFNEEMEFRAPLWIQFLNDLGHSIDTIKRIQQWFGYCLVPTAKIERCLFLKGEGSNGKSTLLEVLIGILGQEQVSCLEPQELFDKFKVCIIQDKLANICSDIETSQVFDARFKKLVSGEDQIGEEKQKRAFKFRPYARFIFSANAFIPTRDRSHAFFRRFDVIEFKRIFEEKEQDQDLKEKLKKEIPYIINWALRGLLSLRQNNWKFSESAEFAETKAEFESAVNPVKQFVEEEINVTQKPDDKLKCSALRERYVNWCKSKGYEVMAENKLGCELKRLGIDKIRERECGKLGYFYKGILLN